MIRILVADDHPLVRNGLRQVLSNEPDFAILGEAENSAQLFDRIEEQPWDVVVLDVVMPGQSGMDALQEIRRRQPDLPVLMLSVHSEQQFAVQALRAGANGYLSKTEAPAEVVRAIRKVVSGKKYVSAALAETLATALESDREHPAHDILSTREFQVLCGIASGKTVSEIAAETALSVKTVSTYRARVLEKMKMRTNAELMRYALQAGLVN
jgi:two-component system, NarL family, invasion response regulator UvrY